MQSQSKACLAASRMKPSPPTHHQCKSTSDPVSHVYICHGVTVHQSSCCLSVRMQLTRVASFQRVHVEYSQYDGRLTTVLIDRSVQSRRVIYTYVQEVLICHTLVLCKQLPIVSFLDVVWTCNSILLGDIFMAAAAALTLLLSVTREQYDVSIIS